MQTVIEERAKNEGKRRKASQNRDLFKLIEVSKMQAKRDSNKPFCIVGGDTHHLETGEEQWGVCIQLLYQGSKVSDLE